MSDNGAIDRALKRLDELRELQPIVPELMTTEQAARYLSCGTRTLWRWSNSGLAPSPIRIGFGPRRAVRYRREDLDEWIKGGCQPTNRGVTHG